MYVSQILSKEERRRSNWPEEQEEEDSGADSENEYKDKLDGDYRYLGGNAMLKGDAGIIGEWGHDQYVPMQKRQRTLALPRKGLAAASVSQSSRSASSKSFDEEGKRAVDAAIEMSEQELGNFPRDLSKCKVVQLQGYLREAGLRSSGLKAELIERVKVSRAHQLQKLRTLNLSPSATQHDWCLQVHAELLHKARQGEKNTTDPSSAEISGTEGVMMKEFPEGSFSISCVGDVCKGDEVLFSQGVFDGFDITTRGGGNLLGESIDG